jgi:hypothetical protein
MQRLASVLNQGALESRLTIVCSAMMSQNSTAPPSAHWTGGEIFGLAGVLVALPGAIAAVGMIAFYVRKRGRQRASGVLNFA